MMFNFNVCKKYVRRFAAGLGVTLVPPVLRGGMLVLIASSSLGCVNGAVVSLFSPGQALGGWHERSFGSTWVDLEPNVMNVITVDPYGEIFGFNRPNVTAWLQSPGFVLESGPILIGSVFLKVGPGLPPASYQDVLATKSSSGWAGIALSDSEGNFVLSHSGSEEWGPVSFSAADLSPHLGKIITLNFINMSNVGCFFLNVNRPITMEGISAVPEPSVVLLGSAGVMILLRRHRRVVG